MGDLKCMFLALAPKWQRRGPRDTECLAGEGRLGKGAQGSCMRKETPFFAAPPKKKRKISKEIRGKVSWSVAAGQRRETEAKFTFVSLVEGWGKSPDPPRVLLDPFYQGAWKDRMDKHPCLGRAWGGASHWAGQLSLRGGVRTPDFPPPIFSLFEFYFPTLRRRLKFFLR